MKRKHRGFINFIIVVTALLAAGAVATVSIGKDLYTRYEMKKPVRVSVVDIPLPYTLRKMETLDKSIDNTMKARKMNTSEVNLILFGYMPAERVLPSRERSDEEALIRPKDYVLTLAFISGIHRLCIIDGALYEEGGTLPDGTRILRVEPTKVLVNNRKFNWWVPLSEKQKVHGERK